MLQLPIKIFVKSCAMLHNTREHGLKLRHGFDAGSRSAGVNNRTWHVFLNARTAAESRKNINKWP